MAEGSATALLLDAIRKDDQASAHWALSSGALLDHRDCFGDTPLHFAVSLQNPCMVRLLLGHSALVDSVNNYGATPLHYAISSSGNEEIVSVLLDAHADINKKDDNGWTAVHLAAVSDLSSLVRLIVERGADLHALNEDDDTAFHLAFMRGKINSVRSLLESNCDVNEVGDRCKRLVHFASSVSSPDMLKLLVEFKADLDVTDEEGLTPLHYAVENTDGYWLAASILDAAPQIIDRRTDSGFTAVSMALHKSKESLIDLLTRFNASYAIGGLLSIAITNHRLCGIEWKLCDKLRSLIASKADVNQRHPSAPHTPLTAAAAYGLSCAVEVLLEFKADVNLVDPFGDSALKRAASANNLEMARILLNHGADATSAVYPSPGVNLSRYDFKRNTLAMKELLRQFAGTFFIMYCCDLFC